MPRWMVYGLVILAAAAAVPPMLLLRMRMSHSSAARIHPILDMDAQPKYQAQQTGALFADDRAMRLPVVGTVARGELHTDAHYYEGKVNSDWAQTLPMPIDRALLERGQERFGVFCAPCHGLDGYGHGPVAVRAAELETLGWVAPSSLHDELIRAQPVGQYFGTIAHGLRTMPAYGPQIAVPDRWAIVAYVRALQRSQHASPADVPEGMAVAPQAAPSAPPAERTQPSTEPAADGATNAPAGEPAGQGESS